MEATETRVDGLGYYLCCTEEVNGFEPCPFCGGEYQELYEAGVSWISVPTTYRYIVRCDCGAQIEGKAEVYPGDNKDGKMVDAAMYDWNRRAA